MIFFKKDKWSNITKKSQHNNKKRMEGVYVTIDFGKKYVSFNL
jgi:hypothetical protein